MAKRFIDTGLFDDSWFMDLSKEGKLLWLYFITKCDHAGTIKFNKKLCQVQTGINKLDQTIKELGNRLVSVKQDLIFIPKYIEFQYPKFPNSKVRQQESALNRLLELGLYNNKTLTLNKDLINSYEHDGVSEHDNVIEPEIKKGKHLFKNSEFYDKELFITKFKGTDYEVVSLEFYYEAVKNWSESKNEMRVDWIATARGFMLKDKKDNKLVTNGKTKRSNQKGATDEEVTEVLKKVIDNREQ